jgi:hypothetical protein
MEKEYLPLDGGNLVFELNLEIGKNYGFEKDPP